MDYTALFDAFLKATRAYETLLTDGLSMDDASLARSAPYRELLLAGVQLHKCGGGVAVVAAAESLSNSMANGSRRDFDRLWHGLLTGPQGRQ